MIRLATISTCGMYRYDLFRCWGQDEKNICNFIMLNPSKADGDQDDPTIRRCIGFAKSWGYDGFYVTNLFAFRATNRSLIARVDDPIGPLNDNFIRHTARESKLVIAAWGTDGGYRNRDCIVLAMLREILPEEKITCLKFTGGNFPAHPLYLSKQFKPIPMFPSRSCAAAEPMKSPARSTDQSPRLS